MYLGVGPKNRYFTSKIVYFVNFDVKFGTTEGRCLDVKNFKDVSFENVAKEFQRFANLGWRNLLSVNFPSKILIFWEIQTISRYQGLENVINMCILVFFDEFVRGNWKEITKDSFLCKNMSSFRCWKNLPFVVYFATFKLRFAEFCHLRSWFFPSLFLSYRCIRLPNISSL